MNIPETQKDLLAYLDRITRELGSTRGGRIQNRLDHFTTASITDSLAISRSLASQYLNELVRAGLVVKAGARPVCYFHRRSLERFFQSRIERSTYPSVEQLFATLGNGERLDFDRAIGHELSLAPCISQLCAALKYPPAGLPILLCGASGTGKGLLAELALEYGKNVGVLQQEAKLVSIDCSHYADDARALTHDLCADGGPADRASGGIVYLKDVDALSPAAQDALLEWASAQAGAIVPAPAVRLIFATSNEADSTECRSLTRRIPMSAQVPSLRERTQEEREELTLHFLKEEGRRIGRDILISRGAFRALAGTNFEENVRGLRDCITNCCAEAYLDTKGDSLEIRTYQLPPQSLPAPHSSAARTTCSSSTPPGVSKARRTTAHGMYSTPCWSHTRAIAKARLMGARAALSWWSEPATSRTTWRSGKTRAARSPTHTSRSPTASSLP